MHEFKAGKVFSSVWISVKSDADWSLVISLLKNTSLHSFVSWQVNRCGWVGNLPNYSGHKSSSLDAGPARTSATFQKWLLTNIISIIMFFVRSSLHIRSTHLDRPRSLLRSSQVSQNVSLWFCSAGDVSPISMSPISQSQFIPLGEILCLAISAMNSARKTVTQETLIEHLATCFPGTVLFLIFLFYCTIRYYCDQNSS